MASSAVRLLTLCCAVLVLEYSDSVILPFPTTIGKDFDFAVQITVPYTIALPKYFGNPRRSVRSDDTKELSPVVGDGLLFTHVNSLLARIRLQDFECYTRLLCKVYQDPNKYWPISDFVFQHVDLKRVEDKLKIGTSKSNSRLRELHDSAKKWFNRETNCTQSTINCSMDVDDVIGLNVIKVIQFIKHFVNLKLK